MSLLPTHLLNQLEKFLLVDEDEDVEVDAILQQHSGDVKFVTWHPQEDVCLSSPALNLLVSDFSLGWL